MDIAGKVALVTGGKRIGQTVGVALARRGADVAFAYRQSRAEADQAVEQVTRLGRRAAPLQADLSKPDEGDRLVADLVAQFGRLDILVNMASVYDRRPFDELTVHHWNTAMDVDLRAAFLCAKAAVPHMRRAGGGRIVNFGDWLPASRRPRYTGYVAYYVAKAGVIALTEALALELAADNILVNAVAPGPIMPPPGTTDEELRAVEQATPVGRWGGASVIADAVIMFVESDFLTGETIRVDGGRHLK
jgi:NAD(P)-dependent dehydrogenase (short-subunit alcohol dehydrogenase family)